MGKKLKADEPIYTTKTMALQLGLDQDTVRKYAAMYGWGIQPGGAGTPRFFGKDDIDLFLRAKKRAHSFVNTKVIDSLKVR